MLSPGAISALVQQAELNQQDPSLSSLASCPDGLGREVQVIICVTVPKLRKTPPYELPEAPYLIPVEYD